VSTEEIGDELRIEYSAEDSTLKLSGELDLATRGRLREAVEAWVSPNGGLTLDLSDLTFADSSGLQEIIDIAIRMDSQPLVLRDPPASFRKLLRITGVEQMSGIVVETSDGDSAGGSSKSE
jgi:anti-anti-sigma factor